MMSEEWGKRQRLEDKEWGMKDKEWGMKDKVRGSVEMLGWKYEISW